LNFKILEEYMVWLCCLCAYIDFEARSKLDMKYRKVTFIDITLMSLDIDLGIRKIKKSSEVKMPYSIRK